MSYADIVLDDSPLLYWPMTSGTAVDSSATAGAAGVVIVRYLL